MKFMNNHYGQSQIFGKARFRVAPDGGNDFGGDDGSGGGSGTGGDDGAGADDGLSADELKIQLAKAKAELERAKHANDKLAKSNKELTDKNRQHMTDEQKAAADQEAKDKRLAELEKRVQVSEYSKRFVGFGVGAADADAFAGVMPTLEDEDAFFNAFGKFIDSVKKTSAEAAVQKLLKDRPGINAGNGDGKGTVADEKAVSIAKRRSGQVTDNKIIDNYKI